MDVLMGGDESLKENQSLKWKRESEREREQGISGVTVVSLKNLLTYIQCEGTKRHSL